MDSKYVTAPTILIVVGCIIFVVAFFGCCGAVKENHCMVMTFGLLVFVIFVVELAGGISAYMYKGEVKDFLKQNMNDSLVQQKKDALQLWDEMQSKWKCCGVDGPQDYTNVGITIPKSCCEPGTDTCQQPFIKGCFPQMLEKVKGAITVIGGVAVGLAVVELLGCMFAWCLASAIKRDYEGV
nr:CD63 antigen [Parasteatoda tepidariorum]